MGYVVGTILGLIAAGITGQWLLNDFMAGWGPGLAAALWFGTMMNHEQEQAKLNMFFPVPMKYKIPLKQAFPTVKRALREYTHKYGRSFRLHPTNPSQFQEIKVDMKWTDVDEVADPSPHDFGKSRKTTVERYIRLEVYFSQTQSAQDPITTIEIRWYPMAEGLNPRACEPVVHEVTELIDSIICVEGESDYPQTQPWRPPVWLHIAVIACLGFYMLGALEKSQTMWKKIAPLEAANNKKKQEYINTKSKLEKEILPQWESFKKSFKPPDPKPRPNPFRIPAQPPVIIKQQTNYWNSPKRSKPSNIDWSSIYNPNKSNKNLFYKGKTNTSGGGK